MPKSFKPLKTNAFWHSFGVYPWDLIKKFLVLCSHFCKLHHFITPDIFFKQLKMIWLTKRARKFAPKFFHLIDSNILLSRFNRKDLQDLRQSRRKSFNNFDPNRCCSQIYDFNIAIRQENVFFINKLTNLKNTKKDFWTSYYCVR